MRDADLMMRVKAGDQSAFRTIVEKYQRRVVNVAYRLLEDRDEAEDVAQETFLKAYLSARSYSPRAELFTYLYTIATNLSLNLLRQKRRGRWLSLDAWEGDREESDGPEIPANPMDSPDWSLEQAEREAAVRRALEALPLAQKTPVVCGHSGDRKVRNVFVVNRHHIVHTVHTVAQTGTDLKPYNRTDRYFGLNKLSRLKDFIFEGFHDNVPFSEGKSERTLKRITNSSQTEIGCFTDP